MQPRKSDQLIILIISFVIMASIVGVYIQHHYIEQKKRSCRAYVYGVLQTLEKCRVADCEGVEESVASDSAIRQAIQTSGNIHAGKYANIDYGEIYKICESLP